MTSTRRLPRGAAFLQELKHQSCHGVDARVPAADHGNRLALAGQVDGPLAAVDLAGHPRRHALLARDQSLQEVQIGAVADNHVRFPESGQRGRRQVVGAPRSGTDNIERAFPRLLPVVCFPCVPARPSAMAMVTLPIRCFWTTSPPPPRPGSPQAPPRPVRPWPSMPQGKASPRRPGSMHQGKR